MSQSLSLNDLLKSVMGAAMDANRELLAHEIRSLREYFEKNPDDGALEPKTLKMLLPQKHINEGESNEQVMGYSSRSSFFISVYGSGRTHCRPEVPNYENGSYEEWKKKHHG